MALWQRHYRRVAGLCIGFLPVLGMALHNWVYGGALVPFTATAAHPVLLTMPPAAYLAALSELGHLDLAGDPVQQTHKVMQNMRQLIEDGGGKMERRERLAELGIAGDDRVGLLLEGQHDVDAHGVLAP